MTVKELVKKYGIRQYSQYSDEEGKFVYTDQIILNGILAKEDNMVEEIKNRKPEILSYLTEEREREENESEERQRKIDAIEGLKEIKEAIIDLNVWQKEFEKSFEDVGGLGVREYPGYDFDEMRQKYPIACAYLLAESYANKSNHSLSQIGKNACDKIIDDPGEYEKIINNMRLELEQFRENHLWD